MNPQAPHWIAYIQSFTRKPVILASPLLKGEPVHLWNVYKNGRKPTQGTWNVKYHWVIGGREILNIEQKPYPPFTRLRSQICTSDEYEAYIGGLNAVERAA